ncbi:DnaB-like helicase N-terminal domain-containing protein [Rhodococcus sp. H29-C3]|uniref:DnaB-like helicase N-terminal domain-containing protein n=1 Tax=Rhodococcus sp. H29-C3 TaxID=3046307 RepID=UPI0024BA894D|nr:DnaB-like helicase N-terminal domain-containing protein [Rhodococcus sp. H29-C3]MDJ0363337.1 DnaB-like helicase N-terminal domain-containing protein [Rhodococcus sp. H29-C3]
MTALRAVPLPDLDPEVGTGVQVAGGETYDLHTDPEALLLCALMWSYHPAGDTSETARITATLTGDDFDDYTHSRLFTVIADLVAAEQPFGPASVTNEVIRSGGAGGKDGPLRRRLLNIATLGAFALTATHNADIVLSQSYRRSFHTAGTAITEAAENLPEEDLFAHMLEHGRRQRRAFERLNDFRSGQS